MHLGRLFVGMARLYPWATKEYLLWSMSWGQIILYYNLGTDPESGTKKQTSFKDMSYEALKKKKEELRQQFGDV